VDLPAKNVDRWTMPLDEYLAPSWDPVTYATQLLAKECMDKTQYDWPLPAQTVEPPTGESWNDVGRKLFNPELARKYGYGNSPEHVIPEAERAANDAFVAAANGMDDQGGAAFDSCWDRASKKLRTQSDPTELAQSLQTAGETSPHDRALVRTAVQKWKKCMAPAGVADLPSDPNEMTPTLFLSEDAVGANIDNTDSIVSDREREVAVLDARCQRSTGWLQASYNAEWDQQAEALRTHADDLKRNQAEALRQRQRALSVIAEHAPTR
jgi:hypothetical protein